MKKLLISLLIGCTILGVSCGEEKVDKAEYDKIIEQNEKLIDTVDRLLKKLDSSEEQSELTTEEEKIDEVKEIEEQSKKEDAHVNEESNSDDHSLRDSLKPFLLIISLLFMFTLIMCFG